MWMELTGCENMWYLSSGMFTTMVIIQFTTIVINIPDERYRMFSHPLTLFTYIPHPPRTNLILSIVFAPSP